MVRFSVFNELSLPLDQHRVVETFGLFFGLLAELKKCGLNQIRMSNDFKAYTILDGVSFQRFVGQQSDRDFKTRLKSFINNAVIEIDTPIVKNDDLAEKDQQSDCEYFYKKHSTSGGIACGDIWNTLVVSFNSKDEWNEPYLSIQKETIKNDQVVQNNIKIRHASMTSHLDQHSVFFKDLESENKLNITQANFWVDRNKHFPSILQFCPEVEAQVQKLDTNVFQQAINILRDIETKQKSVTDFNVSGEGESVCNNPKLKNMRKFTVGDKKVFFQNHIKSLPNAYRIYFLQQNEKIYIGYIGKHLPTKKY